MILITFHYTYTQRVRNEDDRTSLIPNVNGKITVSIPDRSDFWVDTAHRWFNEVFLRSASGQDHLFKEKTIQTFNIYKRFQLT